MADPWDADPIQQPTAATSAAMPWHADPVAGADQPMAWSDVGSQAIRNIPGSAVQFGKDIAQPFIHPIETAKNITQLGHGILQKSGIMFGEEDIPAANAAGGYFANRYGGVENFKKALASDPVGVAGDLSALFTGGETALARAPGLVGRAGEIAGTAARAIDPITNAARVAAPAARMVGDAAAGTIGMMTGAGGQAIKSAAEAGYEGGPAAKAFRENITSTPGSVQDTINEARGAVAKMRSERGTAYRENMQKLGADNTILSWNDVDTAVNDMNKVATYKGQVLNPSTEAVRNQITDVVDNWKNLKASEFWTPEGFDALKQRIGDIREGTERGSQARLVADQMYNGVKKTIADQVPEYAKHMESYSQASDLIKEMESTLSLNPKAPIDTTLRKLQSVLRNNVTTAYGRRADLAEILSNSGAPNLMSRLAGQALNTVVPRSLSGQTVLKASIPSIAAGLGIGGAGAAAAAPAALGAAATLPFMSPRLMGEAAYGAGVAGRYAQSAAGIAGRLAEPSRQTGRLENAIPISGHTLKSIAGAVGPENIDKISTMIQSRAPLRSSAQKYEQAANAHVMLGTPQTMAAASLAARNLSNNLRDGGVDIPPAQLLKSLGR